MANRTTLTISTDERTYTVQGFTNEIDDLFNRLVQETMRPVATHGAPAVENHTSDESTVTPPSKPKLPVPHKKEAVPASMTAEVQHETVESYHLNETETALYKTHKEFDSDKLNDMLKECLRDSMNSGLPQNIVDDAKTRAKVISAVLAKRSNPATILSLCEKLDSGKSTSAKPYAKAVRAKQYDKDGNLVENPTYKGFLVIKCAHCGKVRAFNARENVEKYRCDECGKETVLDDMVPLTAICECGCKWRYFTNMTDDSFEVTCIRCGSPIPVFYNDKLSKYETLYADGIVNRSKSKKKNKGSKPSYNHKSEAPADDKDDKNTEEPVSEEEPVETSVPVEEPKTEEPVSVEPPVEENTAKPAPEQSNDEPPAEEEKKPVAKKTVAKKPVKAATKTAEEKPATAKKTTTAKKAATTKKTAKK